MRILFLLTQDLNSPSGVGRYYPMAKELVHLGYQVTIAALHSNFYALDTKQYKIDGVNIWYVGPMHVTKKDNIKSYYPTNQLLKIALSATWQLSRAALTVPADIVHIGKPHPMNSLAGLAAKYFRNRQVYLDCDDYEAAIGHFSSYWQQRTIELFENWTPSWVEYVTTNTYYTRDRLLNLGVSPQRIIYISNGVDRKRFAPPSSQAVEALRSRLGLSGKKVIAFVGSLSLPGHPVDLLLKAFFRVRQSVSDVNLMLVGGGDDYPRLKELTKQMELSDAVLFCGRVSPDEVVSYYYLADVSVDPIYDDGAAHGRSPIKLFESWACGIPFVTSDVGDRSILLGDPPAGLLTRPGDSSLLAEAIIQILKNPKLSKNISQQGLKRVEDYYWDKLVKNLVKAYEARKK